MFKTKITFLLLGFLFSVFFLAQCGYTADETLTVTTYYPSPKGTYKELMLYPTTSAAACNAANEGKLYYDAAAHQLKVCSSPNGLNNFNWVDFGGAGATNTTNTTSGFWAASSGVGINNININNTNSGSVSIGGVSTSSYKLDVFGDTSVRGSVWLQPNTNPFLFVGRFSSAYPNGYIVGRSGACGESTGLIFRTNTAQCAELERMILNSHGQLIIYGPGPASWEDSSPAVRFMVIGDASVTGNLSAANFPVPSDLRFKKNIEKISDVIAKLDKIDVVKFNWRVDEFQDKKFSDNKQIGVIAQQLEKSFPELVIDDEQGYKTVNYDKLAAVLLEAVKEQQSQIETLKTDYQKQIDQLKMEIEKLKSR